VGRLHAAGLGKREAYERIRASRGDAQATRHPVNKLENQLSQLPQLIAGHLHQPSSRHLEQEINAAVSELYEPGPFTTLTHGDPTVGNLLHSPGGGVKLIDFETAGYRHALLDGCFARLRYVYSVWAHHIPETVQKRLLVAYRAELAKGCPQAADDTVFSRALVAACAAWLAGLCSHLPRVAEADARWGRATYRQRITVGLGHFITVADEYGQMPALRDCAQRLLDRLRDTWPAGDCELPTYPAFTAR
jgi:aminoglycoside phosphotransferase (APT) family kinase protein